MTKNYDGNPKRLEAKLKAKATAHLQKQVQEDLEKEDGSIKDLEELLNDPETEHDSSGADPN